MRTAAQAQEVERVEIYEAGIYETKVSGSRDIPDVATGKIDEVSDLVLVQQTTTVPAKIGTSFAVRYRKVGGASVKLRIVLHYPLPGLRKPATGNTRLLDEYYEQYRMGKADNYTGYTLENDWELVPGTWTFEIWQDDRKLAEQSFSVVKP
jgi:hypothetical protein